MSRRVPNAANRSSPSVMNPRSMLAQPVWQPRQCSITGDDGQRWRGPLKGTRPVTPTEAASRRAWGRQERPYLGRDHKLRSKLRAAGRPELLIKAADVEDRTSIKQPRPQDTVVPCP